MKISCSQFENLLSFYLNKDLTDNLKNAFEQHLKECNYCKEKYKIICSIINNIKNAYEQFINSEHLPFQTNNTEILEENTNQTADIYNGINNIELSAYIDNELPDERSIKIRQDIGSKPKTRKKLEKLYNLRKLLKNSYSEEKNNLKIDFSKNIIKIFNENYTHRKVYMHCLIFIMLVIGSVIVSILFIVHLIHI